MHHDSEDERRATFEGRRLARPTEEVVDQGLHFDIDTLVGRRQMLRALALGIGGFGLVACSADPGRSGATASSSTGSSASGSGTAATTAATEIPDETVGPYPGDGSDGPDVLEDSGIIRSDLRSSFGGATGTADGVPMDLELVIKDLAAGGAGFSGVAVYVWRCDRESPCRRTSAPRCTPRAATNPRSRPSPRSA